MTSPDEHFEQRARELWREAAQRIDPATAGRLRAARRQALETAKAPAHRAVRPSRAPVQGRQVAAASESSVFPRAPLRRCSG